MTRPKRVLWVVEYVQHNGLGIKTFLTRRAARRCAEDLKDFPKFYADVRVRAYVPREERREER